MQTERTWNEVAEFRLRVHGFARLSRGVFRDCIDTGAPAVADFSTGGCDTDLSGDCEGQWG